MFQRLHIPAVFVVLLLADAPASGAPAFPFEDGRWSGDIEIAADGSGTEECWASTTFDDGTTLALASGRDGVWRLRLTNPDWNLPSSHRYAMIALVDFYPQVSFSAEVKSETLLEIADIDRISLLGLIENGHTIDLVSDGFHEKYDLEGSAKVIQRLRTCFPG